MIKKQRYVYYCEFCKKKSLNAAVTKKHEKGCTNNPGRICGLCKRADISELIEKYKKRFVMHPVFQEDGEGNKVGEYFQVEWFGDPVTLQEIEAETDSCPNCTLAILRQTKLNFGCCGLEPFDYKLAVKDFFDAGKVSYPDW